MAFFDGHVAMYNSAEFQLNAARSDNNLEQRTQAPIFYLRQQLGRAP
jgi:hypothetical protein